MPDRMLGGVVDRVGAPEPDTVARVHACHVPPLTGTSRVLLALSSSFVTQHLRRRARQTAQNPMKDEHAALARPETPTGVVPVVQLIWAVMHPPWAQSADVPYITNEARLLFLKVELCHPVWERVWSLLIYSLKIQNSMCTMLMERLLRTAGKCKIGVAYFTPPSPYVCFFSPYFICLWLVGVLPKGNKANTACSNCLHRTNIVWSSLPDLQEILPSRTLFICDSLFVTFKVLCSQQFSETSKIVSL